MAASRPAYLFVNPEEFQPNVSLMIGDDKRNGMQSTLQSSAHMLSASPSTGGDTIATLPDLFLGNYPIVVNDSDGASVCMFSSS